MIPPPLGFSPSPTSIRRRVPVPPHCCTPLSHHWQEEEVTVAPAAVVWGVSPGWGPAGKPEELCAACRVLHPLCLWSGFMDSCKSQPLAWPPATPRARCASTLLCQGHCPATLLAAFGQLRTKQAAPACQQTWHCLLVPIQEGRWPPAVLLLGPCSRSSSSQLWQATQSSPLFPKVTF